jgi:hypothetical protein
LGDVQGTPVFLFLDVAYAGDIKELSTDRSSQLEDKTLLRSSQGTKHYFAMEFQNITSQY